MERNWQRPVSRDGACVVFVHGFLSSAEGCWSKPGVPGWPDLVASSFPSLAVCTVTYNTEVWSGHYSISDVADGLHERLVQDGVLTSGRKLVFVCHSMGGLVVRRMLVQRRDQLAKLNLTIGLFLVASPSLGSDYAKLFSPIARFLGHTQADAMRFSEANHWLVDLDRDFDRLLTDKLLYIVGRELIEDRLVLLRWLWLFPRVVPAFSGARYFPEPLKIELSDHFSIAKPEGPDSMQHGALRRLIQEVTGLSAVASYTRVFISYRHTEPDRNLAVELARAFEGEGFGYFIDRRLTTGMEWQAQIAKELDACTHFVVLISEDSALSDMVRQEIAQAHRRQKRGECSILPVRVAFRGALPTDIASVLDPLQYAHWSADGSTEDLVSELIGAIRGATWSPLPKAAHPAPQAQARLVMGTASGAPMPHADVGALLESGAQPADAALYVRRASDDQLDALAPAPFTLLASGPRQSGKSSLLAQAISKLVRQGQQVVYLDLQQADGQIFESFAEWAYFLARQVHRQTGRGSAPSAGQFERSPMVLLTEFVEDQILAGSPVSLALVLDEVDRVFGRPISIEAFSLLRGWHNNRAQKPSLWRQVSLLLAHSTQPYLWIPDDDRSPFNVGTRIELEDFTIDQVRSFLEKVDGPEVREENLHRLYDLTGGQPYLSRVGLHHLLTAKTDLDDQQTAGEAGIFGDHLRAIGYNLNKRPELITSLRQVLAEGRCTDERHFQRLLAAGLVRGANRNQVKVHRGLYRSYFGSLT